MLFCASETQILRARLAGRRPVTARVRQQTVNLAYAGKRADSLMDEMPTVIVGALDGGSGCLHGGDTCDMGFPVRRARWSERAR
eukprot:1200893-Pleurochrysis_carterae.AAC.3